MGRCLIEGIHAEALAAGHGEISERFVNAVGLAVMMRKHLGHFDQAIAAAALDFISDLCMQCRARIAEQSSDRVRLALARA